MKQAALITVATMVAGLSLATPITISDNFDSGINAPWTQKWTASQNGLWTADSGYTVLSGQAEANYIVINQTALTIDAGESATISSDFRYSYEDSGAISVNKNAFGLLLTTDQNWWAGSNKDFTLANRGAAMGNTLTVAPWIEGWINHSTFGVNTANAETSNWFNISWEITESAGTLLGQATVSDGGAINYTSTQVDLGLAAGTTLYSGYTTGWQNSGTNLAAFAGMKEVHMDNFSAEVIPEPATLGLIGLCGTGLLFARRIFKI